MAQMKALAESKAEIIEQLRDAKMIDTIRRLLPKKMTAERFIVILQTELRRIPELAACKNTIPAFLQAAQLGLEPAVMGECWIIPYGQEAVFIPGYRGLAQLAWRSGLVKSLAARAVFKGDDFDYEYGTSQRIHHVPRGNNDPKDITFAYSIVDTALGGTIFDVMERKDIDKIRGRSRAGTKGPWVTDYAEMAKKTPFRRLMKISPLSVEMRTALRLDDEADSGEEQQFDTPISEMFLDPKDRVEAPAKTVVDDEPPPKPSADAIKANLVSSIKASIERIPEGLNRTLAMRDLFGSTQWSGLESLSTKEIQAIIEGGSVTRIVDAALAKAQSE